MKYKIIFVFVIVLGFFSFCSPADVEFQLSQFVNNFSRKVTVSNNSKNIIIDGLGNALANEFSMERGMIWAFKDFKLASDKIEDKGNCFISMETCSYKIFKTNSSSIRVVSEKTIDSKGHYARSVSDFNFGGRRNKIFLSVEIDKNCLRIYEVDELKFDYSGSNLSMLLKEKENGLSFICFLPKYFYKE